MRRVVKCVLINGAVWSSWSDCESPQDVSLRALCKSAVGLYVALLTKPPRRWPGVDCQTFIHLCCCVYQVGHRGLRVLRQGLWRRRHAQKCALRTGRSKWWSDAGGELPVSWPGAQSGNALQQCLLSITMGHWSMERGIQTILWRRRVTRLYRHRFLFVWFFMRGMWPTCPTGKLSVG